MLNYGLKYDDYERLLATVPTITKALPIREIRKEIRHLDRFIDGRVVGTTKDYAAFNHLTVPKGRFLNQADDDEYKNYAVLGFETAAKLFPYENPLENSVKIGSDYYTVIGVTGKRGSTASIGSSLAGQDYDKDVYIPLRTCRARFGERIVSFRSGSSEAEETQLSQITMSVADISQVTASVPVIRGAVEPFHQKKDVDLVVPYDLIQDAERTARTYSIILGTIASISLLVGGIGIMNIMLASVTERTREIGIRRALGAKRKDITLQFLIETVVLSSVGGLLGVAIGVGIPWVIVKFLPETKAAVTPESVIIAFTISVFIGILAGLYPAMRAAYMDPIEALRHE